TIMRQRLPLRSKHNAGQAYARNGHDPTDDNRLCKNSRQEYLGINGKIEVFRLSSIFSGLSPGLGDCRLAEQAGLGCFQRIQRLLSPSVLVHRSPMPYRADDSSCGETDAAS
ncbi:MAG: hypothetical protein ACI4WX_04305, partial [Aristaeellaceae bacterium]